MLDVHWFSGLMLCICSLCHFVCDSPNTDYAGSTMSRNVVATLRLTNHIFKCNQVDQAKITKLIHIPISKRQIYFLQRQKVKVPKKTTFPIGHLYRNPTQNEFLR